MSEVPPSLDLRPDHWVIVHSVLRRYVPDRKVLAFGSRTTWTAKYYSDLDIAILDDKPLPLDTFSAMEEDFIDSNLPFKVDLVDWARVDESFRDIIRRDGVTIQIPENDYTAKETTRQSSSTFERRGNWQTVTLGQVTELTLSSVDKKTKPHEQEVLLCNYMDVYSQRFIHSDLQFMRATATENEIQRCELQSGDVIITKDSEKYDDIGVPALVRDDVTNLVCGYHLAILRPLEKSTSGPYLFYALQTTDAQHQFHAYANGVTRFGLRKDDILRVQVPLPPLPEQRAIAHVLGTLDDKIELNRRMNETLEAMARALFKSWFVDFDPVRAKMEGRDTGLPRRIADLFPDRLVDSELGEIPEGWEVRPLDEIATFQNGLALQKYRPQENEEWLPVVKIADLKNGKAAGREKATANIRPECIIDDGDVVFSWSGSLIVKVWCGGRAALNQHLFKVTSTKFPKWFFWHCLHSHLENFQSIAADKATTMGHIKRHHLSEALCSIPDSRLLALADSLQSALLDKGISANTQSRTLVALKDALLPKLISGKILIRDAEKVVDTIA